MGPTPTGDFLLTGFVILPSALWWSNRFELAVASFFALVALLFLWGCCQDPVAPESAVRRRDKRHAGGGAKHRSGPQGRR